MVSKRAKRVIVVVVLAACLAGALSGWAFFSLKGNSVAREGSVFLPHGADYTSLLDSLRSGGFIHNMELFEATSKALGLDRSVRSGHYRLEKGMNYVRIVRMFERGLQSPVKVTFNNIRLLPQLAGRVSEQIEADSSSLAQLLTADTAAAHYGFTPQTFISMFIPDTYEMYWTVTPEGFADRMQREYDHFWSGRRDERLAAIGLTCVQATTLASIVYEETKMGDEMPLVAGVYINRLNKGMPLQADPTVKFAVGDFTLRRILYAHLDTDSPYNTYMYAGLPPGPICMPSVRAIDAVLDYTPTDYLYFCAKPDFSGYHNFAVTHAQHERNRMAWVDALNRAGIR